MPLSVLQPRPIAWVTYSLLLASGLAFSLTEDGESVRIILGSWAPWVTGMMLIIGGVVGFAGSVMRRFPIEVAAFPFLIGVWVVYAAAIGYRYFEDGSTPLGFALLLLGGASALVGRAVELSKAVRIDRDLRRRQLDRSTT